jgi:hypothetical protein
VASSLFEFPHPVDETSARLVAGGVVAMSSGVVLGDQPWLMWPLAYGFAARVLSGPRFSPLGLMATRVVEPRLPGERRFAPGPPKRFAQGVGLFFSATALVLHYRLGRPRAAKWVLSALLGAASLEAFAGYCLGCRMFALGMKSGLVPASVCEECNSIWERPELRSAKPQV